MSQAGEAGCAQNMGLTSPELLVKLCVGCSCTNTHLSICTSTGSFDVQCAWAAPGVFPVPGRLPELVPQLHSAAHSGISFAGPVLCLQREAHVETWPELGVPFPGFRAAKSFQVNFPSDSH